MNKDKYTNLEELLKEVSITRSLNTNIDFIVHVQDLIGHSTEEELYRLSKEYKANFYWIYDEAKGIEDTLRFFANYSKFSEELQEQLADAEADRDKFEFLYNDTKKTLDRTTNDLKEYKTRNENNLEELVIKQHEVDELKKEVTNLKAKLYDLTTSQ